MTASRTPRRRTVIVAAMAEELLGLEHALEDRRTVRRAGRDFHLGRLQGHEVVLVLCGIGKVAAATTGTLLAGEFEAARIVFTGVAGGLGEDVRVGDVVVAHALLQHDMDASPLFPRFEVPLIGRARFETDARLVEAAHRAAEDCLREESGGAISGAGRPARVHRGLIISGDRFVSRREESAALSALLPDALAVEMEGAALAQVCHDFAIPLVVVRAISDDADDGAPVSFVDFVRETAARLSQGVVKRLLGALPPA